MSDVDFAAGARRANPMPEFVRLWEAGGLARRVSLRPGAPRRFHMRGAAGKGDSHGDGRSGR
jgi:hypothetical protein